MDHKFVIPDHVLESTSCKMCNKYLTVGPIRAHADGGNICGRCLYDEKLAPKSMFEFDGTFVSNMESMLPIQMFAYMSHLNTYFPCINRYEGCNKLLPISLIRDHEMNCILQRYFCPLCNYRGVGSQQIQHFKISHRRNLLDRACIELDLSNKNNINQYLYKDFSSLYFMEVNIIADDLIQINIKTLPPNLRIRAIEFRIKNKDLLQSFIAMNDLWKSNIICSISLKDKLRDSIVCHFKITSRV